MAMPKINDSKYRFGCVVRQLCKRGIAILLLCLLVLSGCQTATPETDSSTPLSSESLSDATVSTTQGTETTAITEDTTATIAGTASTAAGTATTTAGKGGTTTVKGEVTVQKTTTSGKNVTTTTTPPQKPSLLAADTSRAPSNDIFKLSYDCAYDNGYVYYCGGTNSEFPDYNVLFRKPLNGSQEATTVFRSNDEWFFLYTVCENKVYYIRPNPTMSLYVCNGDGSNLKKVGDLGKFDIGFDVCYISKDWIIYTNTLEGESTELYLLSTDGKTLKVGTGIWKDKSPYKIRVIGFNRGYFYYEVSYRWKDDPSMGGTAGFRMDYRSKDPTPEELYEDSYGGISLYRYGQIHNDYIYNISYPSGANLYKGASLLNGSKQELSISKDFSASSCLWDYFVFKKSDTVYEYVDWQNNRKTVEISYEGIKIPSTNTSPVANTNYMYQWITTEHSFRPFSATAILYFFDPQGNTYKICELNV